jgi:hypothetical protein
MAAFCTECNFGGPNQGSFLGLAMSLQQSFAKIVGLNSYINVLYLYCNP